MMKSGRVVQTYIELFGLVCAIKDQMKLMNCVQIFTNILLDVYVFKISLYDGVFSNSQLTILLKK